MLRTVFTKTLYEKRWPLLGWVVAIVSMTMLTTMFFPTFRDAFGKAAGEIPESMKAFIGDTAAFETLGGFVDVQVVAQLVFLTIIMGVIIGSGLIAGDEGDGTLQSLLAQPVKRNTVFLQKYAALVLLMLVSSAVVFLGVRVSGLLIDESMDWWRMAQAAFGMWLITLVFAVAAYALGAITGKRGLSGSFVGMIAFVSYIITSLAVSVDALKAIDKVSPFHYFNTPSIITFGLDWGNVIVLVGIIAVLSIVGYTRFLRRDIG